MSADAELAALAEFGGVVPRYFDLSGRERFTTPETQRALLAANGIEADTEGAVRDSLAAIRAQAEHRWFPEEVIVESAKQAALSFGLGSTWQLRLDGHETVVAEGSAGDAIMLPPLPSGVYVLTAEAAGRVEHVTILSAPRHLPSIEELTGRTQLWGLNLALYGLRSSRNSGLGDYVDLANVARVAGGAGAGFVGINPVHNLGFSDPAISPYSPSHRGFLNTSHIALDAIPGLATSGVVGATAERGFEALRCAPNVLYGPHKALQQQVLEALYVTFMAEASDSARTEFAGFVEAGGPELDAFARFEALSETHGPDWRDWPTAQIAPPAKDRTQFHAWLQWVAASQLQAAQSAARNGGLSLGLYLDLAVGPRRSGAESWCEQGSVAQGVSIGAPPDHLSPEGQNWELAAFAPRKLRAQNYRPLRRILAQTMRHAGMVRIDHALGLCRSFWIPDDGSPGGYIRQPFKALLAIIKIEAERHGVAVIGEDLGLVPNGFRETMHDQGFYGYSVLQYERDARGGFRNTETLNPHVLSCFATHDTPTIKGFEIGRDIDWWERLGWIGADAATSARVQRNRDVEALRALEPASDFKSSVHKALAQSPAAMVATQLDDLLQHEEAQNLPGTIDQHPSWRRKYAVPVEDLAEDRGVLEVGALMAKANRQNPMARKKETSHEG